MPDVAGALERVRERIRDAATRAGRDPSQVTLVAVSKGALPERVIEAVRAGARDFGENRVAEAASKIRQLEVQGPGGLRWHFVGRLQRNKVRMIFGTAGTVGAAEAVGRDLVCLVHSVDRLALAEEIGRRASATADVLVEVNTSGEEAKGGVGASGLEALVAAISGVSQVRVTGLMTMAPRVEDPEDARPFFRRLAGLRDELDRRFPDAGIRHLSMGMSQDFEIAVEEGATLVRVGAAIFGPGPGGGDRAGAHAPTSLH